jgi:hypothetical protein
MQNEMYCLNRVKNCIDKPSLLKRYYSVFHSNIACGINIYGCANTTNLENFEKSKNKPYASSAMPPSEPIRPHCLKNSKFCLWTNLLSILALNSCIVSTSKNYPPPSMKCGKPTEKEIQREYFAMLTTFMYPPPC